MEGTRGYREILDSLIYSGPEERKSHSGTGFLICKKLGGSLIDYEHIDNGICKTRLKGKFRNITLITVHAPTVDKREEEIDEFYNKSSMIFDLTSRYDAVAIQGDFNTQIGRED